MKLDAKERILSAASQEFSEKGYDGARMSVIARKAKVNQAMLHYYFNTKENLYEQMLIQFFGLGKRDLIIKFFNSHTLNPSEGLYLCIYFFVRLYLNQKNPLIERFLYSQISSGGIKRLLKTVKKFFSPQFQLFVNILKSGVESGDFECSEIEFNAMEIVLFVVTYEKFRMHFSEGEFYDHFYGKDYRERVFNYLIKHTFKVLTPEKKVTTIPRIPEELIIEADKTIDLIKQEINGGLNE